MKRVFYLKRSALSLFIILLPFISFAQSTAKGSLNYLLASNGFGQIKLGGDIRGLDMSKISYLDGVDSLDADSCYTFCYNDEDILDLGDGLQLNLVGFRTYKNRIVNIYLFFPREYGHALLQDFEASYGKFTNSPGAFMYDWKATAVTLSLLYKPVVDMGVAIFTSNNVQKRMFADIDQKKARQVHDKNLLGSL